MVPAQQSRLFAAAPEHGGIVIALLNSTIYVASAIGAGGGAFVLGHASPGALPPAAAR